MPCRDYETDSSYLQSEVSDLKKRLDEITELLCFTMTNIQSEGWYQGVVFRYAMERDPYEELEHDLVDWWEEHKRLDKEEKERIQKRLEEEERRAQLIRKFNDIFTDEEQWELRNIL